MRLTVLLAALAAGPAAWALQLIAGYGLSSLACFPHDSPHQTTPPPGWGGETTLLLAINLACLLLALAGGALCLRDWRKARDGAHQGAEIREGRTRFLALCGGLAGLGFALAILFDTATILGTPTCWNIPS
jgi:hypothetical protein